METVLVDEFKVALGWMDAGAPVLDAAPENPKFVHAMARRGHFTFHLESNPMVPGRYVSGMAFIRKAIVARPVVGNVIFAVSNGEAVEINPRKIEAYVDCHIEYVPAFDLTMISKDLGIQQWGLIKINRDTDDILAELPGPLAQQIVAVEPIKESTERHLHQWYFKISDKLWGLK